MYFRLRTTIKFKYWIGHELLRFIYFVNISCLYVNLLFSLGNRKYGKSNQGKYEFQAPAIFGFH